MVAAATVLFNIAREERVFKWGEERLNWEENVERLQHKNQFADKYRMNLETFNKLLEILRPKITVDYIKSMNSTPNASEPIYPELVMHVGIRWLAGGVYHDIEDSGVSRDSVYRCRDMFIKALLTRPGRLLGSSPVSEALRLRDGEHMMM